MSRDDVEAATDAATDAATGQTIRCLYSCDLCGLDRVGVEVPVRTTEGVVEWTRDVCVVAVARDHARRSPACASEKIDRLLIPMSGRDAVGGPVRN